MKGAYRRGGARKRQWVLKLLLVGLEKTMDVDFSRGSAKAPLTNTL